MSSDVQLLIDNVIKNKNNYYKVLNLEKGTCDDKNVKKSYHKIALRIHPDKCSLPGWYFLLLIYDYSLLLMNNLFILNIGHEEAFKIVGSAFKCLETSDSRRNYDITGSDSDSSMQNNMGGHGFQSSQAAEEFFAQFLNAQRGGGGGNRGFQTFHFASNGQGFPGGGFPGGFAFNSFGQQQNQEPPEPPPIWIQNITKLIKLIPINLFTVPIIIFIFFYLVSYLLSILSRNIASFLAVTFFVQNKYRYYFYILIICYDIYNSYII